MVMTGQRGGGPEMEKGIAERRKSQGTAPGRREEIGI